MGGEAWLTREFHIMHIVPVAGMTDVFIGYHHWSLAGRLISWPLYLREGEHFVPIYRWYHTIYPFPYQPVSTFLRIKRSNDTTIYDKWKAFCEATMGHHSDLLEPSAKTMASAYVVCCCTLTLLLCSRTSYSVISPSSEGSGLQASGHSQGCCNLIQQARVGQGHIIKGVEVC